VEERAGVRSSWPSVRSFSHPMNRASIRVHSFTHLLTHYIAIFFPLPSGIDASSEQRPSSTAEDTRLYMVKCRNGGGPSAPDQRNFLAPPSVLPKLAQVKETTADLTFDISTSLNLPISSQRFASLKPIPSLRPSLFLSRPENQTQWLLPELSSVPSSDVPSPPRQET
jgi:hypothetical protein